MHRRVPKHLSSFTYQIPEGLNIKIGQIVYVPFRADKLPAIVINIHGNRPKYPTKDIESAAPIHLTDNQLKLASWIAEKYKCPFSNVVDFFIPEKIWQNKIPETAETAPISGEFAQQKLKNAENADEKKFIENLTATKTPKLIFEKSLLPRKRFYEEIVKSAPKNSQILILFPEIFYLKKLGAGFSLFHGDLKENEKAAMWEGVKQGKIEKIAGTRATSFLPFKNLSLIIVDFAHHESYVEKRQPNYDTSDVAEKLADISGAQLITVSSTPRVETWQKMLEGKYEKHEWNKKNPAPVEIVDMQDERRKGIFSALSDVVTEKIAKNLSQNKQILLFLNRTGEAGALLCQDCGQIFRCESCGSPFALHSREILKCARCKIEKAAPMKCTNCAGARLKPLGVGTEKLEKEIKKVFAHAQVLRIDREVVVSAKKSDVLDEKNLQKADIIIATQIIDKPLDMPRLSLSVAVIPDTMLNYSDFRAQERLFGLLIHIRQMTNEEGEMIVQTFLPGHFLYEILQKNRLEDFYDYELKTRKSLSLPPFG